MVNKYYQKHKEKLLKEARARYRNISEEEKDNRQKKARERYQNFTEEGKKGVSLIKNVSRSHLSIEEIII